MDWIVNQLEVVFYDSFTLDGDVLAVSSAKQSHKLVLGRILETAKDDQTLRIVNDDS